MREIRKQSRRLLHDSSITSPTIYRCISQTDSCKTKGLLLHRIGTPILRAKRFASATPNQHATYILHASASKTTPRCKTQNSPSARHILHTPSHCHRAKIPQRRTDDQSVRQTTQQQTNRLAQRCTAAESVPSNPSSASQPDVSLSNGASAKAIPKLPFAWLVANSQKLTALPFVLRARMVKNNPQSLRI